MDPRPAAMERLDPWMHEIRWWTRTELDSYEGLLSPRRLRELLRELDECGAPGQPVDVGV